MVAYIFRGMLLVGLVTLAGGAYAQVPTGGQWDKFNISIGAFTSRSSSELQLNSETLGVGTVFDLENTLNVNARLDTVRLDTLYRWGPTGRHQIEFHYFESIRSGDRTLAVDLQIGDILYPAGTTLSTDFDMSFANIDYAYAFFQDDRVRVAVSGGLHVTGVGLRIDSRGFAVQEDESFTAPLPVVGLRLDVALAKNWKLRTRSDVFYLEYENYTGGLVDTYFGVEWNPFKHVGFGLGYNGITYRIEGDGTASDGLDFNGKVEVRISGLLLYARYFF